MTWHTHTSDVLTISWVAMAFMCYSSVFHWSLLYFYSRPSINFIYGSAAIWLCYAKLYAWCSTNPSASEHTSQNKIFINLCHNHDKYGLTSLVTLKTRVWIIHTRVFIHSSSFIWPMLLTTTWTISHDGRQHSAQHYFALRWGPCRLMYCKLFPSAHRHVTHKKHIVQCIWKFCWWEWQHYVLSVFFKTLQCNDLYHV